MNKKMSNPNIKKGNTGKTAKRLMQSIGKYYKKELIIVAICIILSSIGTFSGSLFLQNIVDKCITPTITDIVVNNTSNAEALSSMWNILSKILIAMVSIYVVSVLASFAYNRIMAYVTQGYLKHIRIEMFNKMQKLPIKYFDNNSNSFKKCYDTCASCSQAGDNEHHNCDTCDINSGYHLIEGGNGKCVSDYRPRPVEILTHTRRAGGQRQLSRVPYSRPCRCP